jgi:hypothetical protein
VLRALSVTVVDMHARQRIHQRDDESLSVRLTAWRDGSSDLILEQLILSLALWMRRYTCVAFSK